MYFVTKLKCNFCLIPNIIFIYLFLLLCIRKYVKCSLSSQITHSFKRYFCYGFNIQVYQLIFDFLYLLFSNLKYTFSIELFTIPLNFKQKNTSSAKPRYPITIDNPVSVAPAEEQIKRKHFNITMNPSNNAKRTPTNAIKIQKFHLQVNAGFTRRILVSWRLVGLLVLVVNCLAAHDE